MESSEFNLQIHLNGLASDPCPTAVAREPSLPSPPEILSPGRGVQSSRKLEVSQFPGTAPEVYTLALHLMGN